MNDQMNVDADTGKNVQCFWSAPPNINFKRKSQSKILSDAQKVNVCVDDEDIGGKVHIPDTLEDSDSDSDSFTVKVQKLTGMGESSKFGKDNEDNSIKHAWFVESNLENVNYKAMFAETAVDISYHESMFSIEQSKISEAVQAPEEIITDDNIIHTQESVEVDTNVIETQLEDLSTVVKKKVTSVTSDSLNELCSGSVKDNFVPKELEQVECIKKLMIDVDRAVEPSEDL